MLPPRHREALSDIFEVIDLDGNGLLSLEEYNFFELRTSGEKCDKDAWAVCKGTGSAHGTDSYDDGKKRSMTSLSRPFLLFWGGVQRTLT